jgi:hypothetical protein
MGDFRTRLAPPFWGLGGKNSKKQNMKNKSKESNEQPATSNSKLKIKI